MDFVNQNIQILVAAAAILVLLVIVLAVWRAVSPRMSGRRGQRLGVSEYHEIDKTRRLVLVRRDNVEHLVLLGGPSDIVVESGITATSIAAAYMPAPVLGEAMPARPAPRPPVFGERRPAPLRPAEPSPIPGRAREEPEP
jgi:hypothetical protein